MNFRIRIGIVVIFILAFLITAPLLVLYTAGYRYNFTTNSFVQTGLFYVTTIPKGAEIIINDELRDYSPAFIKNLVPGEYKLTLDRPGYHSWTKTLPIISQETTFIEDVVLFTDEDPVNLVSEKIVSAAQNPSYSTFAYVMNQSSWYEIWNYSIADDEQSLLYRIAADDDVVLDLSWSASGEHLLIEQTRDNEASYTLIDRSGENRFDLAEKIGKPITKAWWHQTDNYAIMFTTDETTEVYRIPSSSTTKLYDKPVLATLIEGHPILTEVVEDQLSIFSFTNDQGDIIAYVPLGQYEIIASPEPYLLLQETTQDKIVLIDTSTRNQPIILNVDGRGVEWAPDGSNRMLYWSALEVHVYNPATHTDELITRVGEPVTYTAWHPLSNAILFVQDTKLSAIELDWRDQRNEILLAEGSNFNNLFVTKNGRRVYFAGTVGPDSGIFELQILER